MSRLHLGEKLRAFRIRQRIKQEALAADLGVSQATISRLESGAMEANPQLADSIEALLSSPTNQSSFDYWRTAVSRLDGLFALFRLMGAQSDPLTVSRGFERWAEAGAAAPDNAMDTIAEVVSQTRNALVDATQQPVTRPITIGGANLHLNLQLVVDDHGSRLALVEIIRTH